MKYIRNVMLVLGMVFAVMGLIFVGVGAQQRSVCERLTEEGVSVQAVCYWESGDELRLLFEAEGQQWNVESMFQSDSIPNTGEEITVYYMPGNPESARVVEWWTYGIFLIIGGVFATIGLVFLVWQWRTVSLIRSLRINGQKVVAQVIGIEQVHSVRINGRCPYVLRAVCTHPYSGNKMTVRSRLLMYDPTACLADGQVEVLVDMMNEKRYHVLLE